MGPVTKSFAFSHCAFLLLFLYPSTNGHKIELCFKTRVFVALKGENLNISYHLKKPRNISDFITCFDSLLNTIYVFEISTTTEHDIYDTFVVKNVTISGKYFCQFKTAKAFWFLRVRDSGYKEVWNYTEVIIVSVITALLLVFSVGGTVYVFRGTGGCCKTQNKESIETQKEKGDTANAEPAHSTSFYASLEARPRSVYDALDHSAAASAGGKRHQQKAKTPKKNDAQKTVRDAAKKQEDGIFECVYENF
ncbi:NFAT activation molecule 1 [Eucyclogobius newberryi]|uniref:NFAT activation molecule 1 n=1 Tax=Eucyclogobius newberryi TaxID=166745 RepID=UPI003B5C0FF8